MRYLPKESKTQRPASRAAPRSTKHRACHGENPRPRAIVATIRARAG
jgi:hypothetical protein